MIIAQILRLKGNPLMPVLRTRIDLFHTPPHHHVDQLLVGTVVDSHGVNLDPIPENRDSVPYKGKFLHPVGHIDNTDSLCLQPVNLGKQGIHLPLGQGGGGLVKHHDSGVKGKRLGYLHHLLFRNA